MTKIYIKMHNGMATEFNMENENFPVNEFFKS